MLIHDPAVGPKEVFTSARSSSPSRGNIREPYLPPTSDPPHIPAQKADPLGSLIAALLKPPTDIGPPGPPPMLFPGAKTTPIFKGGKTAGLERIDYMFSSSAMTDF